MFVYLTYKADVIKKVTQIDDSSPNIYVSL